MNLFVVDPGWGWWIVLYFFLGGIAAGAYFTATLIDLTGKEADRRLATIGYGIAFPLILLCGVFLIVDLHRPERFWHMLVRSEVVHEALEQGWPWKGAAWSTMLHAPLLKFWSPMSVGSWALGIFGLCSFLSLLGSLWPGGRLARWLRHGVVGKVLAFIGSALGFFVASYTGALVTATNQPIWSDTAWVAPLFLASAASTGMAAMILMSRHHAAAEPEILHRLGNADLWALILEAVVFAIFLGSLGDLWAPLWRTAQGKLFVIGTAGLAVGIPLLLHLFGQRLWPRSMAVAAGCALVGGFILRYGLLTTPPELLREPRRLVRTEQPVEGRVRGGGPQIRISPEDGRERGGGSGADPGNKAEGQVHPRSKVFRE
jgi:formate-dependent nitrite reductase membrane component NrfD